MTDQNKTQNQLNADFELLKFFAIFLAKCYQDNFNTFADVSTFSIDVKNIVHPVAYQLAINVNMNFSTAQGIILRQIIEHVAGLCPTGGQIDCQRLKVLFDYKHPYSPTDMQKTIEFVQRVFEKPILPLQQKIDKYHAALKKIAAPQPADTVFKPVQVAVAELQNIAIEALGGDDVLA